MKAQRVMFATDLSLAAREALHYAASLAHDSGAELLIAHVVEPATVYSSGDSYFYGSEDPQFAKLMHMLAEVVPANTSVRFRHKLVSGNAAEEIIRLAEQEKVDLIVMTTHGRTGLKHLLLGSVAESVVRQAKCPVLTIKPAKKPQSAAGEVVATAPA